MLQQLPFLRDLVVLYFECCIQIVDLCFESDRLRGILRGLIADQVESCCQALSVGSGLRQLTVKIGTVLEAAIEVCTSPRQFAFELVQSIIQFSKFQLVQL